MASNSANVARHVVLTGPPGIGKTTLIKQVCESLKTHSIQGFYTEEVRVAGRRQGFDVITLDGDRAPLARIREDAGVVNTSRQQPRVGNYVVQLQQFESLALPTLKIREDCELYVVDEVGKMELFSRSFEQSVKTLLDASHTSLLITIPVPKSQPMRFVESIRSRNDIALFEVSHANRNSLLKPISEAVKTSMFNNKSRHS